MQVIGVDLNLSSLMYNVKRLGFSRKKGFDTQQCRKVRKDKFQEEIAYFNANMLVWTDECGSDRRNEIRKHGYNLRGMTPVSYNFITRGKCFSAILVLTTRGIDVFVTDKTVNGDIFLQFVEQRLVPACATTV